LSRFAEGGRVVALLLGALLTACSSHVREPATTTTSAESLPFIHDDYPRAIAEAKKTNKPLFVDAWAPWCHSCMSLKTYVLTDPSLAPLKDKFVWLSVDTEKDMNAQWVARYVHEALPTLWIIDPATDKPLLKWAGTATAPELKSLLIAAISNDASTASFVRGNHAQAEGDSATAIAEHKNALASATPDQRSRVVEALVTDLNLAKAHAECADIAATEAPKMAPGTSRASVIVMGLDCAGEAKKPSDVLLGVAIHDATARDESILPDDRSAIYEAAISAKKDAGDSDGAKKLAQNWVAFLDAEAKKAATKDARTSLDPWRLAAYIAVGEPAKAIPVLEQSAADFPNDYNPPARLARVYLILKRLDEAEKAADRATALVYGPRAMRVCELRADIAKERGDKAGEIKALEDALSKSEHAVLTQGQRTVRDKLAARLAALR
jgi:thiol-disulfide isomerase/thioredoxin